MPRPETKSFDEPVDGTALPVSLKLQKITSLGPGISLVSRLLAVSSNATNSGKQRPSIQPSF